MMADLKGSGNNTTEQKKMDSQRSATVLVHLAFRGVLLNRSLHRFPVRKVIAQNQVVAQKSRRVRLKRLLLLL